MHFWEILKIIQAQANKYTSAISCAAPTNVWCQVRAVSCYAAALAACVTV